MVRVGGASNSTLAATPSTGKRVTRFITFHETKRAAQNELARLVSQANAGDTIEPSKLTLREYFTELDEQR